MESNLYHLMYVSVAAHSVRFADVAKIATQARIKNAAADISGLLVFDGERFCQFLEGPAGEVRRLFDASAPIPDTVRCISPMRAPALSVAFVDSAWALCKRMTLSGCKRSLSFPPKMRCANSGDSFPVSMPSRERCPEPVSQQGREPESRGRREKSSDVPLGAPSTRSIARRANATASTMTSAGAGFAFVEKRAPHVVGRSWISHFHITAP
jgi:hypothetical protein